MRTSRRIVIPFSIIMSLLLAWWVNAASNGSTPAHQTSHQALGEEVHAGTFEDPRRIEEPAWKGAVFFNAGGDPAAFYIAAFDSQPDQPNPAFPAAPQSDASWTYAGQHSGIGPDLKPFDEPTRIGALHVAQIDNKNALLQSKIEGVPSAQTPYPTPGESNDFWDFLGFFAASGAVDDMKNDQDLAWPGVYVYFDALKTAYQALRTGHPAIDNWPTPDSENGAAFWRYAGTLPSVAPQVPKPWSDRSVVVGSYYHHPQTALRHYYYEAQFTGFPALLGAAFPAGSQSDRYWQYAGRHSGGAAPSDPKPFGEHTRPPHIHRARIEGKWTFLGAKFTGNPSTETPYPTTLADNDFWDIGRSTPHAGTWHDPKGVLDTFTSVGNIHALPSGDRVIMYRSMQAQNLPPSGWNYGDAQQFQHIGTSIHAGTVADPKGPSELTWPGAVHLTDIGGTPAYFVSTMMGTQENWPFPTKPESNEHWNYIPVIEPLGTFEAPRHFDDYSQAGSVFVDGTVRGQRRFYVSSFEGYPADDIDSFSVVGVADPYWAYAGRHAGTLADLKPFDDMTRVGAIHEGSIEGQRALLRSRFAGMPSDSTPYPKALASNDHWEFIGVFKHAGTADDLKGRDEVTWPGALHLDEAQQLVFSSSKNGTPPAEGWVYPVGEISDENWTFATSVAQAGTAEAPRARNSLSVPGTMFVGQRGLNEKKLFRAKFAGFAADVKAVYPSGTASNEFYEYAGEHAGTFTDPKTFEEPTWSGAVHQTTLDGALTFLKARFTGVPSAATPYPQTPTSNEFWEFAFTTEQAGTVADPKGLSGQTWPGAVHEHRVASDVYLVAAQQFGNPTEEGWPAPGVDSAHWKTLGKVVHKGTFADPKGFDEFTSPGLIHAETLGDQVVYYRSLVEGMPQEKGWDYPYLGTHNAYWEYLGRNLPEGTWEDPKKAWSFTWPGRIHSVFEGGKRLYLTSKVDGFPAEHDWPIPEAGENDYWKVSGESKHGGSFFDPKTQEEVTWVGAIHARKVDEKRTYYRSEVAGDLAGSANAYPLPEGAQDNEWWGFAGVTNHAGTLSDPMVEGEVTWLGAVHKLSRETGDEYYTAHFSGVSDSAINPFPESGQSNENWNFMGKHSMAGTLEDPKDAHEVTWPGLIHRFERDGKRYFVRSKVLGAPNESGWQFPTPPGSDDVWEYLEMGIHAGSWEDLKHWSDATWPGALHVSKIYLGAPPKWRILFYKSKFWGNPATNSHYPPYHDTQYWDPVGFSLAEGTLDSPKGFQQPTWRGAIHMDVAGRYFEAQKNGEIGKQLELPPTTDVDTDSWRFLGASRRPGTVQFPKLQDDFTWPGRVHLYEHNGKKLYFTPLMTGTPSKENWPYPSDESSNEHWYFHGTTEHAGTYADPHQRNEVTWRGAIHIVKQPGKTLYFAAKQEGIPEIESWPYPVTEADNLYFRYINKSEHAGTLADPKGDSEVVFPGDYVKTRRDNVDLYFIAQSSGTPKHSNWPFPLEGENSLHWKYFGASRHAGTIEDPKEWTEVCSVGDVLVNNTRRMRLLFRVESTSIETGIPSQNGWTRYNDEGLDQKQADAIPDDPDIPGDQSEPAKNPGWKFLRVTDHYDGTIGFPKMENEWTVKGKIHETYNAYQTMLFKSRFDGKMHDPAGGASKPIPDGDGSNQWWEFMRKGAGTETLPNVWKDYSLVGDINVHYHNGERWLFKAKAEGRPSDHNWYYPSTAADNSYWEYLYKHEGTVEDPKEWNENTAPGKLHRYETGGKTLFFSPRFTGNAADSNYYYPSEETSNARWTYKGTHLGTLQDPKVRSEPSWPGRVNGPSDQNLYFLAKETGVPADKGWAYPTSAVDNAYWRHLDTSVYTAPGINDFSKPFDQYTWVTAHNAYKDNLWDQLIRGVRGFMLDLHTNIGGSGEVMVCHPPINIGDECLASTTSLREVLADTFLPFLRANRTAVVTLEFESTVAMDSMHNALNGVPGLAELTYSHPDTQHWATLQEIIDSNRRLIMFSDGKLPGSYEVGGKPLTIYSSGRSQVENTYNLGNTVITDNWECESRYGGKDLSLRTPQRKNPLFVLNQFHAWGSSTLHAGEVDNNLTFLQRRVERYCGVPSAGRKPNYLAIDFNQVGDAFPYAAALTQGGFYFYEKNGTDRDGDTTCVLPANQHSAADGVQYDIRLGAKGCENDEIRSMEFEGIAQGTRIELYDSPDADRQDDFTIIDVKQSIPMGKRIKVDSLEGSSDNFYYRKTALHNNGLDGKVSRIKVKRSPQAGDNSDAQVVFYEGNNASQNIVCTVPLNKSHHFKMGSNNNSYGCDNDEIRSALIISAGKGTVFSVTGHPEGAFSQGRTAVTVKRAIDVPVKVGSFNSSFENDDIKVEMGHGGNLDGKISYAYFNADFEPPPEPEPEPDPGAPSAPGNFRISGGWNEGGPITLSWDKPSGAVRYRVFWYFKNIGDTSNTSMTYSHPDSVAGRYHVVAFDEAGRRSPKSAYAWVYPQGR